MNQVVSAISDHRLVHTCAALVDVATPTGYERETAALAVALLEQHGIHAHLLEHDERQASAWARIPGGDGPTILLYSPIDTVTTGATTDDIPHVADTIVGHLLPHATISHDGSTVTGLGAHNPKGHAACIIETAAVLAGNELTGDVIVAFGAGGMPTEPLDRDDRDQTGHGVGVNGILREFAAHGLRPDASIVAKSGWFVQHEEVGLAWIDVHVTGTHTYVGARHRLAYRNPIADLAHIVLAIEADAADSTDRRLGTLEPQTMVANVSGGWSRTAAFLPQRARLRVDCRLLPGETGDHARRRIDAVLDRVRIDFPGLDARSAVAREIAGSHTDRTHWICTAAATAWETIEERTHPTPERLSGSTDANLIRNAGIPTVRIGLPKVHVAGTELGFAEGMNTVDADAMRKLTELLVRATLEAQDRGPS